LAQEVKKSFQTELGDKKTPDPVGSGVFAAITSGQVKNG